MGDVSLMVVMSLEGIRRDSTVSELSLLFTSVTILIGSWFGWELVVG